MEYSRIAVDTSKAVFTIHCTGTDGKVARCGDLSRSAFIAFIKAQAPGEFALEACAGSHHWGRELRALGHRVKLIPPQYVKPFVRRGKTDRGDARAISEAASRPELHFVPVKSAESQADLMVLNTRNLLVSQRTQLVNSLRGSATEFGIVVAKGIERVAPLLAKIASTPDEGAGAVPPHAKAMARLLGDQIAVLDQQIETLRKKMVEMHKANECSRRLAEVPGIGPIAALTLALSIDPKQFEDGRHLAAFVGLTPKSHSSGGKHRMGGISRAGNEGLRSLLVVGAMAVIRHAKPGSKSASPWLLELLKRKPRKVAACALANKTLRIVWAMMSRGEAYRHPGPADAAPVAMAA